MSNVVVTQTKKARTFIQERKKTRQVDSVIRNLANHVNTNIKTLNAIINDEKTDNKVKVEAIKTLMSLYKDMVAIRDRSEIERLERELKYREELAAQLKTEDEWEEDDEDDGTPFVDVTEVVPVNQLSQNNT